MNFRNIAKFSRYRQQIWPAAFLSQAYFCKFLSKLLKSISRDSPCNLWQVLETKYFKIRQWADCLKRQKKVDQLHILIRISYTYLEVEMYVNAVQRCTRSLVFLTSSSPNLMYYPVLNFVIGRTVQPDQNGLKTDQYQLNIGLEISTYAV